MKLAERKLTYTTLPSPAGELLIAGEDDRLHLLSFPSGSKTQQPAPGWRRCDTSFSMLKTQLRAYFAGELTAFDVALAPSGTEFQLAVWHALREIPYGATASYASIAQRIGRPAAVRAVGAANGANPIPIIVPCHRVIGSGGALTGFGGGLPLKRLLLDLEARNRPGESLDRAALV